MGIVRCYTSNTFAFVRRDNFNKGLPRPSIHGIFTLAILRMDEFKHQMSRQGWNQAPQELWSTERIKERIPIMDIEGAGVRKDSTF